MPVLGCERCRGVTIAVFESAVGAVSQQELDIIGLALGRGEAAQRALKLACDLRPHRAEPYLNLALLYDKAGEPELSHQCYCAALQRDPEDVRAREWLKKPTPAPV